MCLVEPLEIERTACAKAKVDRRAILEGGGQRGIAWPRQPVAGEDIAE
jgi:hypothetical protein